MTTERNASSGIRTALVTGGSRGIGRAACMALAAQGNRVAVHYRSREDAANEAAAQIREAGGVAVAVGADLLKPDEIGELVQTVAETLGPIDILVNNAGEMTDGPVETMSDETWERALALNLSAAFRCSRACLPAMKAKGWGRVINVSTQAVFTGSANHAHYAAAKAGLHGFTFSLAKEVGPLGITVNLIVPGRIRTDMLLARSEGREEEWLGQTPLNRLGVTEEVGGPIAFLASDAASYMTGAALNVSGGLVMG